MSLSRCHLVAELKSRFAGMSPTFSYASTPPENILTFPLKLPKSAGHKKEWIIKEKLQFELNTLYKIKSMALLMLMGNPEPRRTPPLLIHLNNQKDNL